LGHIIDWPHLQSLEFLWAQGDDPMTGLQVTLERQVYAFVDWSPPSLPLWQGQTIYKYT